MAGHQNHIIVGVPRERFFKNLNPPNGDKRKGTPIIDLNQWKMENSVNLVEIIGKSIKIEATWWNYLKIGIYRKTMKNGRNFVIC